jgi:hypothetical protein
MAFCIVNIVAADPGITTATFDSSTEGWAAVRSTSASRLHPDGYLCADDPFWKAPLAFTGDVEDAYNSILEFRVKPSHIDDPNTDSVDDVILIGAGLQLTYDTEPPTTTTDWTNYTVTLNENAGWVLAGTTTEPTQAQMEQVLAELTDLIIRGDFNVSDEESCLDQVTLQAVTPDRSAETTFGFDVDRQGWAAVGDNASASTWLTAGGNPRGHLCATDAWWSAPLTLLGDIRDAYGTTLTFDLKKSSTQSDAVTSPDIILRGHQLTLYFNTFINPGQDWTAYRIPLSETAGWTIAQSADQPTQAEFIDVLSTVDSLLIRGDYSTWNEEGCIDNVVLDHQAEQHPIGVIATFDNDAEDWTVLDDAGLWWEQAGGHPRGHICTLGEALVAPRQFLGDLTNAYGLALTFDLKKSATIDHIDALDDVALIGQQRTLQFNFATNPGQDWTAYRIPLSETAGWTLGDSEETPTREEFIDTLAQLVALRIRSHFSAQTDEVCLDNVIMHFEDLQSPRLIVSISGSGRVADEQGLLNCPGTCGVSYDDETTVTLTATPATGWHFLGWTEACAGISEPVCTVTVSTAQSVIAVFGQQTGTTHTLSLSVAGPGSVVSIPSGLDCGELCLAQFDASTPVVLTAVPNTNAELIGWDGACLGQVDTCVLTMIQAYNVVASFRNPIGTPLALTLSGAGQVASEPSGLESCSDVCLQTFPTGLPVTLTATSHAGQHFSGWGGDCIEFGSAPSCQLLLNHPQSVVASFVPTLETEQVTLTTTVVGDGSIIVDSTPCTGVCNTIGNQGTTVVLRAVPDADATWLAWGGVCADHTDLECTVTLEQDWQQAIAIFTGNTVNREAIAWQVAEIYLATLGYAPDAEGLHYWVNQIETVADWTPETVAQSFFDQPLVQALYPETDDDEQLITALYHFIFNRGPDAQGLTYWRAALQSGQLSRNQAVIALIHGGWGNPEPQAQADMLRFRHRVEVALAFVDYQTEQQIVYSQLSAADRAYIRKIGYDIVRNVTADPATKDQALEAIATVLGAVIATPSETIQQQAQ